MLDHLTIASVGSVLGAGIAVWRIAWPVVRAIADLIARMERMSVRLENHMAHTEQALDAVIVRLGTQDEALKILLDRSR